MIEIPTQTPVAQQQYNRLLKLSAHTFAFEVIENYHNGYFNKEQAAHLIEHFITKEKTTWHQSADK